MISCASKLEAHFKHSALACGALKDRQQQMNISKKKLVQSSSTRWNSTFYMLERLIKMRWPVIAVFSDESVTKRRDRYLGLTKEQWMLAEELLKILKPFEVATTVLCGEEHATISCTLPILYGLIKHLEPQEEFVSCLATFRRVVLNEIKRRWELDNLDVSSCMVLASVLDPRFKPLKFLNEEKNESVKVQLISRVTHLIEETLIEETLTKETPSEPPEKKSKSALDILIGKEEDMSTSNSNDPREHVEQYLLEKPVPRQSYVLIWWKDNSSKYPQLASIARELLSIPTTSATSERIFSTLPSANKLQSTLKPNHINALVFFNKNLKLLS